MGALRSRRVRGPYHVQLIALLLETLAKGVGISQESLARACKLADSTAIGKRLLGKGGTFDLDEADAALLHIGSSLRAFVTSPAAPATRAPALPPPIARLLPVLLALDERGLKAVVATARRERAASRRARTQSKRPRAVARADGARKTGGTR